jgi:proteasome-associated ATPase
MGVNSKTNNDDESKEDGERKEEEVQKLKEEFTEELEMQKRQYEREISSLKFEMQRKDEKIEILEDTYEKVKKPPLLFAYVIRLKGDDLAEGQVVVSRGNEILKVNIGISEKPELILGQYVWVHPQTYAIVEVSGERHRGIIARIHDVIEDKIVICVDGDTEKRLARCSEEMLAKIKPGFQLSVLPPRMDILEIIPNIDVNTLLLGEKPDFNYNDIGGLDDAIERVKDVIVLPYQEKDLFAKVKLKAPKGILLYGPPGCGKTLLAKAVASETHMTFFNVSIADILSKWVGESERIIKEIFRQAKERAPSIVFFDEIEAIFTTRGMFDSSGVRHVRFLRRPQEHNSTDSVRDGRHNIARGRLRHRRDEQARPGRPRAPQTRKIRRDNRDPQAGQEGRRGNTEDIPCGRPAHRPALQEEAFEQAQGGQGIEEDSDRRDLRHRQVD